MGDDASRTANLHYSAEFGTVVTYRPVRKGLSAAEHVTKYTVYKAVICVRTPIVCHMVDVAAI